MGIEQFDDDPKKQLLGEILIKRNLINAQQLDQALEVQKKEDCFIGEILVRLGFIEERDVVIALVVQCNLPYIAVDKYELDPAILQIISSEFAHKHHLIPLDRVGKVLSVVMLNPLDIAIRAELQRITNYKIAPFIATKSEIDRAIDRWYGKKV